MKKIFKILKGFEKYTAVAVFGAIIVYSISYVGVEYFSIKPFITYFVSTSIAYIVVYFLYAIIFKQKTSQGNLFKYIINTFIFFLLNNLLFNIFVSIFNIYYLIAITINYTIFPLAKFLSYKYIVFKKEYE